MTHLKGIDVSHWQGTIDWPKVAGSGIQFAICKATDGLTFVDNRFQDNWLGANAQGLVAGAYHYFQEEYDGYDQANHFADTLYDLLGDPLPPCLFVLDYEDDSGVANATSRERLQACVAQMRRRLKKFPILYTSEGKWESLVRVSGGVPVWTPNLHLWVAYYGANTPDGDLEERENSLYRFWLPQGWIAWRFWQYTSKGVLPGIAGNVDLNFFRGSLGYLQKLAARYQAF